MAGTRSGTGGRSGVLRQLRVAAYGVCVAEGRVLLARLVPLDGAEPRWTMPGGGLEHGEDPLDAVVREVEEETGYRVSVERLLGIDSFRRRFPLASGAEEDFHAIRAVYAVRVTGGALRNETGGTTDRAAWFDLDEVRGLDRVDLVDRSLGLHRELPANGSLR